MLSKKDIKKLIRSVLRQQRGLRDHQIIHPTRDWMVGFIGGLILLIVGAAWSFTTYKEVGERDVESVDVGEVKQTVYREDMVNAALEQFRERKEQYEALINQPEVIVPEEVIEDEEESDEPIEEVEVEEPEEPVEEIVEEESEVIEEETPEEEQPSGPPTDAPDVESGV